MRLVQVVVVQFTPEVHERGFNREQLLLQPRHHRLRQRTGRARAFRVPVQVVEPRSSRRLEHRVSVVVSGCVANFPPGEGSKRRREELIPKRLNLRDAGANRPQRGVHPRERRVPLGHVLQRDAHRRTPRERAKRVVAHRPQPVLHLAAVYRGPALSRGRDAAEGSRDAGDDVSRRFSRPRVNQPVVGRETDGNPLSAAGAELCHLGRRRRRRSLDARVRRVARGVHLEELRSLRELRGRRLGFGVQVPRPRPALLGARCRQLGIADALQHDDQIVRRGHRGLAVDEDAGG